MDLQSLFAQADSIMDKDIYSAPEYTEDEMELIAAGYEYDEELGEWVEAQ